MRKVILLFLLLFCSNGNWGITPDEFMELGFGAFPHYGLNTYIGNTGWEGNDPIDQNFPSTLFNPTHFDAEQWVKAYADAGMRYVNITAKHHYGWCSWNSAFTDYDIGTSSVPDLDMIEEVSKAAQKYGLKLALYYSAWDRVHYPDLPERETNFNADYTVFAQNQLTELLTNYGEIAAIWIDTAYKISESQAQTLKQHIKSIQPGCLAIFHRYDAISDVITKEPTFEDTVAVDNTTPWESVGPAYEKYWVYTDNEETEDKVEEVIDFLWFNNRRYSNYSLAVSPGPNGLISPSGLQLLKQVGAKREMFHAKRVDDANPSMKYAGNWFHLTNVTGFERTLSETQQDGASLQFDFIGTTLSVFAKVGPQCGQMEVILDGESLTTIDCYRTTEMHHIEVLSLTDLPETYYSLTLRKVESSSQSTAESIYIDEIAYNSLTVVDDSSEQIVYSNQWDKETNRFIFYDHTFTGTSKPNEDLSFSFTGSSVFVYMIAGKYNGFFQPFMDGVQLEEVDGYKPTGTFWHMVFDHSNLSNDYHTLTLRNTGQKNDNALGTGSFIDFLAYSSMTVIAATDAETTTVGTWGASPEETAWREEVLLSQQVGDLMRFDFTGDFIEVFGSRRSDGGKVEIRIDGILLETLDTYAPDVETGVLLARKALEMGSHSLQIQNVGNPNPASSANAIALERFEFHKPRLATGIEGITELELAVYPNPTRGNFYIETNTCEPGEVNLVISTLAGQVVLEEEQNVLAGRNRWDLSLSGQNPGIYLLTIKKNKQKMSKKIFLVE